MAGLNSPASPALPDPGQVARFKEEGVLALPEFFTKRETECLASELDRFQSLGWLRNVATDGDGKTTSRTKFNLQICPIASRVDSPLIKALPFAGKVREAVSSLIGDPFVFYLDQIFLKPGPSGVGTSWHTDNAYFRIKDPSKGTGMWIALHDATVENGTMHVIPRSHHRSPEHARDPGSDHHITFNPGPEEEVRPVELKAGGVLFFNFGIAHSTRENRTEKARAGLALHFLRQDFIPDFEKDRDPRLRFPLSGAGYDGGRSVWSEDQTGLWEKLTSNS